MCLSEKIRHHRSGRFEPGSRRSRSKRRHRPRRRRAGKAPLASTAAERAAAALSAPICRPRETRRPPVGPVSSSPPQSTRLKPRILLFNEEFKFVSAREIKNLKMHWKNCGRNSCISNFKFSMVGNDF